MNRELVGKIIKELSGNLPLIAEEGNYRDKVSRDELCGLLKERTFASPDVVEVVLEMIERQWRKAGLMDPFELDSGNWQFISFPASLAARSWLEVLSDEESAWFPSGWWNDPANQEFQREMLIRMEQQRLDNKPNGNPKPIRQIYVAWALIKIDGHLLFCEREDRERENVPHFVLPGGRLNIHDLPKKEGENIDSKSLESLQSPSSPEAIEALPQALKRELKEELELSPQNFKIKEAFPLEPFLKQEGAGPNHAYTRYEIFLFPLELNFEGFRRLSRLEKKQSSEVQRNAGSINWFSLEEAARAQQGVKRAFIDAWLSHHDGNEEELLKQLIEISDSFTDKCLFEEMIDFPAEDGEPFKCGPTGANERECHVELEREESEVLIAMVWHRLHGANLPLEDNRSVSFHRLGWIEVQNPEQIEILLSLQKRIEESGLKLIESFDRNWFRISVPKGKLFFQAEFFTYELMKPRPDAWELKLHVSERETPFGTLPEHSFSYPLHAENMFHYLRSVEANEEDEEIYQDQANMMRNHLDPLTQKAGLRKFVRMTGGLREIVCLPENP